jgi:hypothetical protein
VESIFFEIPEEDLMDKNILFKTKEKIYGYLPRDKEWIRYEGELTVKAKGKSPVVLDMTFIPPHPPWFELPEIHQIKGENVTDVYTKVVKFFRKYGIEFK